MPTAPPPIAVPWKCTQCKEVFFDATLQRIEPQPTRATLTDGIDFIARLLRHVQDKHPEITARTAIEAQQFVSLMLLSTFSTEAETGLDQVRWQIHRRTRRVTVTDRRIAQRVDKLMEDGFKSPLARGLENTPAEHRAHVRELIHGTLTEMRNIYEERGQYPG